MPIHDQRISPEERGRSAQWCNRRSGLGV